MDLVHYSSVYGYLNKNSQTLLLSQTICKYHVSSLLLAFSYKLIFVCTLYLKKQAKYFKNKVIFGLFCELRTNKIKTFLTISYKKTMGN